MTVDWKYVAVAVFFAAVAGVIGWYVAMRRRADTKLDHPSLMMRATSSLVLLLALGSVMQIFYYQREQARQSDELRTTTTCQFQVNQALIKALVNRQSPTADKDQALTEMVQAVLNAKTPNDTRVALRNFIDATNALNKSRTDNPYPTIPSDCRPK